MNTTLRKKIIGNELYLFNGRGELIFKRWLDKGYSKVFQTNPSGTYGKNDSLVSITDGGIKYNY